MTEGSGALRLLKARVLINSSVEVQKSEDKEVRRAGNLKLPKKPVALSSKVLFGPTRMFWDQELAKHKVQVRRKNQSMNTNRSFQMRLLEAGLAYEFCVELRDTLVPSVYPDNVQGQLHQTFAFKIITPD